MRQSRLSGSLGPNLRRIFQARRGIKWSVKARRVRPRTGHRVPRVGVRDSARRRRPSRTPPARPSTTPREAQDATDTRRADGTFPRSGTFTHAGRGPHVADFFSPCEGSSGDGTRFHVIFLPPPGGGPSRAWRRRDGKPATCPLASGGWQGSRARHPGLQEGTQRGPWRPEAARDDAAGR